MGGLGSGGWRSRSRRRDDVGGPAKLRASWIALRAHVLVPGLLFEQGCGARTARTATSVWRFYLAT